MAPFTYDTPPPSPLVGSIGDLIARGGLQRAQLAEALAQTQSRAQVANAQAWGNATQSLGQLPIQMQEQARRDQLANVDTAYKLTQMQGAQAQLADQQQQRARRLAAGLALQKSITANTDPTTGEIDAQKVFTDVSGPFPDDADAWLKSYSGAQSAFDARAKSKRADADAESVLVGRLAQAAPSAAAFVDSLATAQAADHVSKKTVARVTQDLATTNAWDPLKAQYVSTADALLPPVTLKDGETLVNAVSNTPRAEQPKEIKVEPGQKIYQGTNPDGTPKLLVQGGEKDPTYTPEQVEYAKTQGHDKPTFADIQAVANAATQRALALAVAEGRAKSGQTWEEFQRQQDYLNAHKDAVKAQGKPLPLAAVDKISDADKALDEIRTLKAALDQPGATGTGAWLGTMAPSALTNATGIGTASKETQAQINRVRQVIGRQIHGGVMRANDQVQAQGYMPQISDSPALVASKIAELERMITAGRADNIGNLGKNGYDVSKYQPTEPGGPPPPADAASAGYKPGDIVNVGGKRVKISTIHSDGTFDGAPVP